MRLYIFPLFFFIPLVLALHSLFLCFFMSCMCLFTFLMFEVIVHALVPNRRMNESFPRRSWPYHLVPVANGGFGFPSFWEASLCLAFSQYTKMENELALVSLRVLSYNIIGFLSYVNYL